MNSIQIKLGSIDNAIEFVRVADRFPQKITIRSDNYSVNAKSILGVLSIRFNTSYRLEITEKNETKLHYILTQFSPFIVSGSN